MLHVGNAVKPMNIGQPSNLDFSRSRNARSPCETNSPSATIDARMSWACRQCSCAPGSFPCSMRLAIL